MDNVVGLLEQLGKQNDIALNVAVFGKVQSYDSSDNTATIKILSKADNKDLPELVKVPILYYNLGGFTIKSPVNTNDRVLVIFIDYDTDNLILDGSTIKNNTSRMHALDDAIALPFNFNPLQNSFNATSTLEIQDNNTSSVIRFKTNGDIELDSNRDIVFKTNEGIATVNNNVLPDYP